MFSKDRKNLKKVESMAYISHYLTQICHITVSHEVPAYLQK